MTEEPKKLSLVELDKRIAYCQRQSHHSFTEYLEARTEMRRTTHKLKMMMIGLWICMTLAAVGTLYTRYCCTQKTHIAGPSTVPTEALKIEERNKGVVA